MKTIKKKQELNKLRFIKKQLKTGKSCGETKESSATRNKIVESVLIKGNADVRRRLLFNDEYLIDKYETLIEQKIHQNKLSPRNIEALKVLDEIMSTPDEMGEEWWEEYFAELDKYRFKI